MYSALRNIFGQSGTGVMELKNYVSGNFYGHAVSRIAWNTYGTIFIYYNGGSKQITSSSTKLDTDLSLDVTII